MALAFDLAVFSFNVAKAPQTRMPGICMELWSTITGSFAATPFLAIQEARSWAVHRQDQHAHSLIKGKASDCGSIVPDTTKLFVSTFSMKGIIQHTLSAQHIRWDGTKWGIQF